MNKRTLLRHGYTLKHSQAVGWWVDGAYGYLVAGYSATEVDAVKKAADKINAARRDGARPAWLFI